MFNPVHYRKTWESIGKPFDPPAVQRLEAPWSAISLLKSILGATMGIIPPGAVGTEQLAQGAVTFDKIRTVAPHSLVGRALNFSGEVQEVFTDERGIVFDGINKMMLAPAVGDVTAPIGTRTFTLANSVVGDNNIKFYSIDLTTKAAIATPNKLWGTTGSGTTFQWSNGTAIHFENNTISVITGPGGVQPYDAGLTQLSQFTAPGMYWLTAKSNWQIVTMGAGLTFSGGVLTATGSGGGGLGVSGQVQANQLAAFTSSVGNFVRGVNLPPEIVLAGNNMQFQGNLAALAGLSGTNTLYYRISDLGWGPVSFSTAFTFNGTLDLAPGLLRNLQALNPVNNTYPLFHGNDVVTAEPISPFSQVVVTSPDAAAFRTAIGAGTPYQLDADLASISAITATNALIYRVSADTWAPVTIGANLTFTGGTLSATGTAGGNVSAIGSPAANTLAFWTSPTTIDDATLGSGLNLLAGSLQLDPDLVALAGFTLGVPVKLANATWQAVNFSGGLNQAGGAVVISDPNLVALIGAGVGAADRLPYFTSPTAMALAVFTSFSRSLVASADAAAARTLLGVPSTAQVQPLDADLTSLAAASAINSLYYRSAADTWGPVTIGANLTFTGGVLAATGGGAGSGDVTSSGTGFSTSTLAGYADTTGDVIRAVTFPAEGFGLVGSQITLNSDLGALEALAGTGVYYRSATSTWSLATFNPGITFSGGQFMLSANLVALHNLGTTAADQLPYFTGVGAMAITTITANSRTLLALATNAAWLTALGGQPLDTELTALAALTSAADQVPYFTGSGTAGIFQATSFSRGLMANASAGTWLSALGGQPLDADLSAIAALTGTNTIYYRSAANVWSAVMIGSGLTFTGGSLVATADTTGLAPLASPAFTGVPTAPTAATATDTTQLATCAYVQANVINLQPLDGDLTSLAAASSIAIYYRQGTNSWAPVTVGTGLSFTGGVLSATAGAGTGDVTSSGAGFTTSTLAGYADTTGDVIRAITMPAEGIGISGTALQLKDDLAALEAVTGTNSIYRRSGTNTWSAITYGTGISLNVSGQLTLSSNLSGLSSVTSAAGAIPWFTDGAGAMNTFASTSFSRGLMNSADAAAWRTAIGAGDAVRAADNTFTANNFFTGTVVVGHTSITGSSGRLNVHGGGGVQGTQSVTDWNNSGTIATIQLRKARSATDTPGVPGTINAGDSIGQFQFLAHNGTTFANSAALFCSAQGPPYAGGVPTQFGIYTNSFSGGDGFQQRMFIDAFGRLVLGVGGAGSPYTDKLQVVGTDGLTNILIERYSADANPSVLYIDKSRGTSIGSIVAVQANDFLGQIIFRGADTAGAHIQGITLSAYVLNAPSSGVVPSRFIVGPGNLIVADAVYGVQLKGTTQAVDAAAGIVGEYPTPVTFSGGIAAQTIAVAGTISLPAGDWDVWVQGNTNAGASTTTITIGLSTTTSMPTVGIGLTQTMNVPASTSAAFNLTARFTLPSTTSVNFIVNSGLNALSGCSGGIFARRRR
jgi:hypothetical protein